MTAPPIAITILRRRLRGAHRRLREARMFARAMQSAHHPIMAQIVPTRRCNLACAYCNEYDHQSLPVPTVEMLARVNQLAALGTTIIDISGGEPLLHPDLDAIIQHIRRRGLIASLITNGSLLSAERIARLNRAGLDHLQISIDNARPDAVSKKSLSLLDHKLQLLARLATFDVNINSVIGGALKTSDDALVIARRASELGFTATVGLIHDASGRMLPLDSAQRHSYEEIERLTTRFYSPARHNRFQEHLARAEPNAWHCRAGARYLYICEDGLVHWCSQQRGYPGIPLSAYTSEHLERECHSEKSCAPYCTVSCVHRVAFLDELREQPIETVANLLGSGDKAGKRAPISARLFSWMFVTGRPRRFFRGAAQRVFGVR